MNNRVIKFRVWDGFKMYYPWGQLEVANHDSVGDACVMQDLEDCHYIKSEKECIIQQFTGLKDKEGREIYEGDIIKGTPKFFNYKTEEWKDGDEVLIGNVFYVDFWATYQVDYEHHAYDLTVDLKDVGPMGEIIGNIWENKELLT